MMPRLSGRGSFDRSIFAEHPVPLLIYDARTLRILDANDAAEALYEYSRTELLASTIDRVTSLEDLTRGARSDIAAHRTKSGRSLRVRLWKREIDHRGAKAILMSAYELGTMIDAQERLSASEDSLALVQQLAHVGTFSYDRRTGQRCWSDETYRIIGLQPGIPPLLEGFWSFSHPDDADAVRSEVLRARSEHREYSVEHRIVHANGNVVFVHERGRWEYDESGVWCFVSGTLQDISERAQAQAEIRYLAYNDPLTDLLNRSGLMLRMKAVLEADAPRGSAALVLFNVDRFKTINDTLGHGAGDQVLIAIAQRLRSRLRPGELLARLGGDEFVVVLPGCVDRADISLRAEHLLQTFRTPFIVDRYPYSISTSAGISVFPADGSNVEELLRNADVAMYQSKSTGTNRFNFYTTQMQDAAAHRFELERGLRRGLDQHEFAMHYQPIVDARTGRMVGVEALIRWRNGGLQLTPPGEFVEFAEETGAIEEIGDWIFETTFAQAKTWSDAGLRLRVWVNVSAVQLHAGLPKRVHALLQKHELLPECVGFELTESSFINANAQTSAIIDEIKALGIRLALDDFGVKYSSLEYLQRLPLDTLKIDRVFVTGVDENRVNRAIIQAIVTIAHEMQFKVSAEGVETPAELETVRSLGCDTCQGFFFSRPRAPQDIPGLLNAIGQPVR